MLYVLSCDLIAIIGIFFIILAEMTIAVFYLYNSTGTFRRITLLFKEQTVIHGMCMVSAPSGYSAVVTLT